MIQNLPSPKTSKKSIRVGRGIGSKRGGHTTGKGTKGQKSRSGYKKPRPGFEGGQNPLSKRLPKLRNVSGSTTRTRLFKINKTKNIALNLSKIDKAFKKGDEITLDKLKKMGLVKPLSHKNLNIKILFDKEIEKSITLIGLKTSKKVKKSVEKAGGKINN